MNEKLSKGNQELQKALTDLLLIVESLTKEVKELRIDVDKLIENNQGGRYAKPA